MAGFRIHKVFNRGTRKFCCVLKDVGILECRIAQVPQY